MSGYCYSCMGRIKDSGAMKCPLCSKDLFREVPPHHLPAGTVLRNRYVVGYSIGEGGFGITYIGHDTILDMKVAIKEFYPTGYVNRVCTISNNVIEPASSELRDFFENGKERFLSEARVLARFSGYSGIVSVRDFFDDNNTVYMVMEYVDGMTLSDYLKEHGIIPCDEAVQMLTPVMHALKEIHLQKIIHCDINPRNIMICSDGKVKLLDFGAAKGLSGLSDRSAPILLCPGYASEEQYRRSGVQGPWTDVYSLCAVLYRCITGRVPVESVDRLANDTLVSPIDLNDDISLALNNALMKGLSVHHEDRIGSIEQLMSALSCQCEHPEDKTVCVLDQDDEPPADTPAKEEKNNPESKTDEPEHEPTIEAAEREADSVVPGETAVRKRINKPLTVGLCSFIVVLFGVAVFFFFGYRVNICGESVWGGSTVLELSDKDITTADIVEISKLPFLQSVSFNRCGLHNLSGDIAMSPDFKVSSLSFTNTGGGIDYILYNLPHKELLQTLKIESCGEWLSGSLKLDFKQLSGLQKLELSETSDVYAANWNTAKNLESFVSRGYNFSSYYSDLLRDCENLRTVTLNDCYVGNIGFIQKLTRLEYLNVNNSYVTNTDFLKTFERSSKIEIHTDGIWS